MSGRWALFGVRVRYTGWNNFQEAPVCTSTLMNCNELPRVFYGCCRGNACNFRYLPWRFHDASMEQTITSVEAKTKWIPGGTAVIRRVCNNIDSREGWKPERLGETGREQPQAKDNIINFLSLVR